MLLHVFLVEIYVPTAVALQKSLCYVAVLYDDRSDGFKCFLYYSEQPYNLLSDVDNM